MKPQQTIHALLEDQSLVLETHAVCLPLVRPWLPINCDEVTDQVPGH